MENRLRGNQHEEKQAGHRKSGETKGDRQQVESNIERGSMVYW